MSARCSHNCEPTECVALRRELVAVLLAPWPAYRQDALRCAVHLRDNGPTKAAHVAGATGVGRAGNLMRADHYGWFERVALGIYALTPKGQAALADFDTELRQLSDDR